MRFLFSPPPFAIVAFLSPVKSSLRSGPRSFDAIQAPASLATRASLASERTTVRHRRRPSCWIVSHLLRGSTPPFRRRLVTRRFGPREKQLNVAEFIFRSLNLIPVLPRASRRALWTGDVGGPGERTERNERPQLRDGSFVSCRSLGRDGLFKSRRPLSHSPEGLGLYPL